VPIKSLIIGRDSVEDMIDVPVKVVNAFEITALLLSLFAILSSAIILSAQAGPGDWPTFHEGPHRTGVTAEDGPEDASVLWTFETGDYVYSSPVYYEGYIYVGSGDNFSYCLDAGSGDLTWSFETGAVIQGTMSIDGGKAFVPSYDHTLYCLDAYTGEEIWRFETGGSIFSSPAVIGDMVVFGSADGMVYCLDRETGGENWRFPTTANVWASPATDGNMVYIGSGSRFYCLDLHSGQPGWFLDLGESIIGSAAIYGGDVFVGTTGNNLPHALYSLDASNGMINWRFSTPGNDGFFSSPAVNEDLVVVGAGDRRVHAIDRETGDEIWNFPTGGVLSSSPAITEDRVFIGSGDHKIYCIDLADGSPHWTVETGDVVYSSPCVADGGLWVGSWDHKLYCLGEGGGGPGGGTASLSILEPDGVDDFADSGYLIRFDAGAENSSAALSLFYGTGRNASKAEPIVNNLSMDAGEYLWNTSRVEEGSYYVPGVLVDGNVTLSAWSEGAVVIRHEKDEDGDDFLPGGEVMEVLVVVGLVGVMKKWDRWVR